VSIFWRRIIGSVVRAVLSIGLAFGGAAVVALITQDGAFDWNGAILTGAIAAVPVAAGLFRAAQAKLSTWETPPEVKEFRVAQGAAQRLEELRKAHEEYLAATQGGGEDPPPAAA